MLFYVLFDIGMAVIMLAIGILFLPLSILLSCSRGLVYRIRSPCSVRLQHMAGRIDDFFFFSTIFDKLYTVMEVAQ